MSHSPADFRKIRRMEASNALLQILLLAVVFTGFNYLAARFYKRIAAHVLNVLSSVVMPLHKLDYYDEKRLAEAAPEE